MDDIVSVADTRMDNVTFAFSIICQILTGILSIIALSLTKQKPPLLEIVLVTESSVQLVEFLWYLNTLRIWWGGDSVGVWTRYVDWFVTTPTMLFTLYCLIFYFNDSTYDASILFHDSKGVYDGNKVQTVITIFLCNLFMLLCGFAVEVPKTWSFSIWQTKVVDNTHHLILFGFFFLIVVFPVSYIPILNLYPSTGGWVLASLTFVVWLAYGLVAMYANPAHRNAGYNILDVLSKNSMGILVSLIVFFLPA